VKEAGNRMQMINMYKQCLITFACRLPVEVADEGGQDDGSPGTTAHDQGGS